MYGLLNARLLGASIAVLGVFLAGWFINGWKWEAKYQSLLTKHSNEILQVQEKAKIAERKIQAAADRERKFKDAKVSDINATRDGIINGLHNTRASRKDSVTRNTTPFSDGTKLYREDAEFLIREAARADQVMAEWQACYRVYQEVRTTQK